MIKSLFTKKEPEQPKETHIHKEYIDTRIDSMSAWEMMSDIEKERTKPEQWMFQKAIIIMYKCPGCNHTRIVKEFV